MVYSARHRRRRFVAGTYYGVALYLYYAMLENGDESAANYYYFTYVAFASYCYWAENGDLAAAYDTYMLYLGYAAAR